MRTLKIRVNKTKLAKEFRVSRSSLYYKRKREEIDLELKRQIEAVMVDHKDYGHKRIALHLKMGYDRIRRVMKKCGLKPYRRRVKKMGQEKRSRKVSIGIPNLVQPLLKE